MVARQYMVAGVEVSGHGTDNQRYAASVHSKHFEINANGTWESTEIVVFTPIFMQEW
jgi:hypothetical protein